MYVPVKGPASFQRSATRIGSRKESRTRLATTTPTKVPMHEIVNATSNGGPVLFKSPSLMLNRTRQMANGIVKFITSSYSGDALLISPMFDNRAAPTRIKSTGETFCAHL